MFFIRIFVAISDVWKVTYMAARSMADDIYTIYWEKWKIVDDRGWLRSLYIHCSSLNVYGSLIVMKHIHVMSL